jgi:predicted 3-demethylubiquinone-9 3-methyltransferase (glyoxalase superfamily)
MGCEIVRVYNDHGISGAKSRDERPEFDRLLRDAAQRKFEMVMAWSVDRLGRSLQVPNQQLKQIVGWSFKGIMNDRFGVPYLYGVGLTRPRRRKGG